MIQEQVTTLPGSLAEAISHTLTTIRLAREEIDPFRSLGSRVMVDDNVLTIAETAQMGGDRGDIPLDPILLDIRDIRQAIQRVVTVRQTFRQLVRDIRRVRHTIKLQGGDDTWDVIEDNLTSAKLVLNRIVSYSPFKSDAESISMFKVNSLLEAFVYIETAIATLSSNVMSNDD